MSGRLGGVVVGAALLLSACVSAPPRLSEGASAADFTVVGRVLVREEGRADVLRMSWRHEGATDAVRLETALGQTVAELEMDANHAHVKLGDGRELADSDDRVLAYQILGVPLPLRHFADWARGVPAADAEGVSRDAAGDLQSARDAGWTLSYAGYGEAGVPHYPALIEARNGPTLVRLKVESWTLGKSAP